MPSWEAQVELPGQVPFRLRMTVTHAHKEEARRIFASMNEFPVDVVKVREVLAAPARKV